MEIPWWGVAALVIGFWMFPFLPEMLNGLIWLLKHLGGCEDDKDQP